VQFRHGEYCCRFRTDISLDCIDGTCVWEMHHPTRPEHVQSMAFAFCCEALSRQEMWCVVFGSNGHLTSSQCNVGSVSVLG